MKVKRGKLTFELSLREREGPGERKRHSNEGRLLVQSISRLVPRTSFPCTRFFGPHYNPAGLRDGGHIITSDADRLNASGELGFVCGRVSV